MGIALFATNDWNTLDLRTACSCEVTNYELGLIKGSHHIGCAIHGDPIHQSAVWVVLIHNHVPTHNNHRIWLIKLTWNAKYINTICTNKKKKEGET